MEATTAHHRRHREDLHRDHRLEEVRTSHHHRYRHQEALTILMLFPEDLHRDHRLEEDHDNRNRHQGTTTTRHHHQRHQEALTMIVVCPEDLHRDHRLEEDHRETTTTRDRHYPRLEYPRLDLCFHGIAFRCLGIAWSSPSAFAVSYPLDSILHHLTT